MKPPAAERLDGAKRALEKERSRAADVRALESARTSVAELRAENEVFVRGRTPARIDLAAARALA
jgi:hypothetical protein